MKNTFLLLGFLYIVILSSCSKDHKVGSGNIISEDREIASFIKITNIGIVDVEIIHGTTRRLELRADDNIIDDVKTSVSDNELEIDLGDGSYSSISVKVIITIPSLSKVKNTGSGNVEFNGFHDLLSFSVENIGSGNVKLDGESKNIQFINSGSGNIAAFSFLGQLISMKNEGSGNCSVTCYETLSGENKGSGNVFYKGQPTITITNSGTGSVIDSN